MNNKTCWTCKYGSLNCKNPNSYFYDTQICHDFSCVDWTKKDVKVEEQKFPFNIVEQ
jgi:hypothetical protein